MTTKNEYTKWEYNKEHGLIFADGIAVVCVSDLPDGEATAKLICTLVNAAQEIGEPMKVAEKMVRTFNEHKAMYDALKEALPYLNQIELKGENTIRLPLVYRIESVLSAIEKE